MHEEQVNAMTAQEILVASLAWKDVVTHAGVSISPQSLRLVNSLVQYLCASAELSTPTPGVDRLEDVAQQAQG